MIESLRVAVVDDDIVSLTNTEQFLKKYEKERGIRIDLETCDGGTSFLQNYKCQYDIVILDIFMPVTDGIEVAQYLRKRDPLLIILFLSSSEEFIHKGYELDAIDYIKKPLDYKGFSKIIDKAAIRLRNTNREHIVAKNDDGLYKLYLSKIMYFETYQRKVKIHYDDREIVVNKKLKEYEEELIKKGFFRCHSGFLVNIKYINEISGNDIFLANGEMISLSQHRKKEMLSYLDEFERNGIF